MQRVIKKFIKSEFAVSFLLILTSIIVHWRWVSNLAVLTWGDWTYQDPQTLKDFFSIPSIWSSSALGDINIGISFTPFQLIYSILAHVNFSYGLAERVLFFWLIIIAIPLCSYFLIKHITNNSYAALVGSIVYSYNTYFSEIKTGHLTLLVAFAFCPLVILFFQKTIEKKSFYYALLTAAVGFIVSFYEFRAFYILCFILFFYFIYFLIFLGGIRSWRDLLKISFFAGLPIIIDFLLNVYWLIAIGKAGSLTSNVFFDRTLFGNEFLNINYAFSLSHPFWSGGRTTDFISQPIQLIFWILPFFAFLGLFLQRKNKNILFWGIIALLGIFLTKQVGQPFSGVYPWLYEHFPGFNAFREASKFFFLIALGYSVLIAAFIDSLWKDNKPVKIILWSRYLFTILLGMITLLSVKPLITAELATLFIPRQMPTDYQIMNTYINKETDFSRTFWVPTFSRWNVYTKTHPEVSDVNQINGAWLPFIEKERKMMEKVSSYEVNKYTEGELVTLLLQKPYANTLLDISSIKYVVIPLQDSLNDDNFFRYYGKERAFYIQQLNKLDYLKRIDIETKSSIIYENEDFRPHLYVTTEVESINKAVPYSGVEYSFINPSEYTVRLHNVKRLEYLHFSESFHPQWQIRVGDFSWIDALTKSNYFLPLSTHKENDAFLNSFVIDPNSICKNFSCKKNNDGSYDITLTLYFYSQSYVYLGMFISGGVVIGIIGYFIVFFIRQKINAK